MTAKRHHLSLLLVVLVALFVVLLMPLSTAFLGTYKLESCVDIRTVSDTANVTLSTLSYPNSTVIVSNVPMSQTGTSFNYTTCRTEVFGEYIYSYCDGNNVCFVNSFEINGQGQTYTTAQGMIYIVLFALLVAVMIGLLWASIGINGDNVRNEDMEIIAINYKKYFKMFLFGMAYVTFVALMFFAWNIASGILNFDSLANFFFVLFRISYALMYVIIPVLFIWALIIWLKGDNKIFRALQKGFAFKEIRT